MLQFADLFSRIATPILAVVAILLSVRATKIASRQAKLAQRKAAQEEEAELSRVLCETLEMKKEVGFLDEWIWDKRIFTRKREILDALAAIKGYWKRNDEPLRRFLGAEARPYKALHGLYDIALQNEDNCLQSSQTEWRGITQDNLLGYKVADVFFYAANELQRKRG